MIKKALGFIAAAMTATITCSAYAEGAIRSIDPCDEYGMVIPSGSVETAYKVGQKAYFRIRLLNENADQTYDKRAADVVNYQNPWKFVPVDSFWQDDVVLWYSARPKVGVIVSGKLKFAEVLDQPKIVPESPWYSDIICAYTVESGDLAFPMLLANDAGDAAANSSGVVYRLENARSGRVGQPWRLVADRRNESDWNAIDEKVEVDFRYGNYYPEQTPDYNTQDYDLLKAGLYIQAIDFDKNFESDDATVWRYTHERYTGTDKYTPSLAIPGADISTNSIGGKVYLWSGDTNTVALPDAQLIGTNMVLTIDLDGDAESLKFRIRGVNKGQATLYLSSTPTNITYESGKQIVNYVTRTVECLDPLPPTVQVLVNDSSDAQIKAAADYQNSVAPFEINLTQAWTENEPVKVKLTYKVNGKEIAPSNLVALSYRQANGYTDELPTEIEIPAGETSSAANLSNPRFIYALGSLTSTLAGGDTIEIIPSFDDPDVAAYYKTVEKCVITLCGMTPAVSQIDEYAVTESANSETLTPCIEVRGGIAHNYQVYLSDDYRDMKGLATNAYTVLWRCDGTEVEISKDASGNALKPSAEGVLMVPYTFAVPSSDRTVLTTLIVRDASGNRSAVRSFYVKVKMPKSIAASVGASVLGEGAKLPVTFTLTEPSDVAPVYVFLEPANEAATNNTDAPFFVQTKNGTIGTGVAIGSGETEVLSTALASANTLEILDNAADVFTYNVRLCSSQTWDATKEVKDFTSRILTIASTNNAPVVKQVLSRNTGTGLDKNTTSLLTMCLTDPARTFRVNQLNDVDADKNGEDDKQMVYRWAIYMKDAESSKYSEVPNMVIYKVGLNSELSTEDIFGATINEAFCGTYKFSVRAQDKDMRGVKPEYLWEENGEWKYSPERPGYGYEGAWQEFPENMGNEWGDEYTFELKIDKNPYIEAAPYGTYILDNDGTPVFTEKDLITGEKIGFFVGLNAKPNVSGFTSIPVEVVIEPDADEGGDGAVNPEIAPAKFTFTATVYSNKFNFTNFDGNWVGKGVSKHGAKYKLTARVPANAPGSIDGTPMADYFDECVTYFRVENSAPIVTVDQDYMGQNNESNAINGITYAPNERFNFRWSVSDVASDLAYTEHGTSNLIVTCAVVGGHEIGIVSNQSSGVFSVWFDKPGINKLKISATDKDGDTGYSQIVYFFIETSKNVFIYPSGPANNSESQAMQAYISAVGRGVGYVWADGNFGSIKSFMHTWTYGPSARSAKVFAAGYNAGATDTQTYAGKSIAMKTDGTDTGDTAYVNNSKFDSFFYRWFLKLYKDQSAGQSNSQNAEKATWEGEYPNPQVGKEKSAGSNASQKGVDLPSTEINYTYGDTWAMAVFSRELFEADNLGDINFDGIPDYFAVKAWSTATGEAKTIPELKTGNKISGGEEGEEEGKSEAASTASDLADIADYMAEAGEQGEGGEGEASATVAMDSWGWRYWNGSHKVKSWGAKTKFTAYDKIRGFGDGLNFKPGTVSDWDLADNEKFALIADYVAAGNALAPAMVDKVDAEGNKVQKVDDEGNPMSDADGNPVYEQVAQDVVEATLNGGAYTWAIANNWSCEPQMFDITNGGKNLNPAVLDTDSDGLPDAWEYFFWYYAKAGAMVGDKWMRMTGSRFSLAKLGSGETISAEEIANAFHPGIKRPTLVSGYDAYDFDGDGLTDVEEYVLGTNPVHWDSDGDGISDFYEVLNGTDPLSDNDGNRLLGAASFGNNPDRDFMAWSDQYDWKVVTFENGQKFATPAQSEITLASALGEEETAGQYAVAVVDDGTKAGVTYYVDAAAADYVYTVDKVVRLAKDVEAWKRFQWPEIINPGETPSYWISGKSVTLPAGTVLKKAIDAAALESAAPAVVDNWKVWSAEFGEMVSTNMTLRLFVYGTEDAIGPSGQKGVLVAAGKSLDSTSAYPTVKDKNKGKVVSIESGKTVSLIHNQVFAQDGFDPRVAWGKNLQGAVSDRWSTLDTVNKGDMAGAATNTVPYSTLDEYLVMQYRYEALKLGIAADIIAGGAEERCNLTADQADLASGARSLYDIIRKNSTVAADALEFVYTNAAGVVTEYNVRGADSDTDGIPDGWELYVKADPNWATDATLTDLNIFDKDGLNLLTEYIGTDSCAAYSHVDSIATNGPSYKGSAIYGWYNKFFPTNPNAEDTDEDGIVDSDEGGSRNGKFWVGRNQYETSLTFVFGTEDIVDNGTSKCIRGGGLNPCTVDTDMDLLPDGWEYEFAGVVVDKGSCSVKLSNVDQNTLLGADGLQEAYSNDTVVIRGGMDGTFADDCNYDFDHDGLVNYQEYLVQSLRHLRYDDSETPLMGRYFAPNKTEKHGPFVPMQAWDGDAFHDTVKAAGYGASSAFKYRELGYFTLPPKSWDRLSFGGKGNATQVGSSSTPGYRIMLRPYAKLKTSTAKKDIRFELSASSSQGGKVYNTDFCMYASTDPRQWDSDGDGMDDYYELFHGLNPLLGSSANPYASDTLGHPNIVTYDRIAMIYAQGTDLSEINAWCNAWTGWNEDSAPEFDAVKYPWMMGTAEADADGDSIRNADEALLVNVTSPMTSHTDPTPLWFTDSSNIDNASYAAQYYRMPMVPGATGSELLYYPWSWHNNLIVYNPSMDGSSRSFMFAFEENEGYDTDRDGIKDATEHTLGVTPASDPLVYDDPDRRQALWLDGVNSAAITYNGGFQRAFSTQYDLLRQFTVECWVKSEALGEQVILERVSDYSASTLSNNAHTIRANFRLGIDSAGRFYGEYEGNTADAAAPRVTDSAAHANDGKWHHLALSFNGDDLVLYVDGNPTPVAIITDCHVIPANGIAVLRQEVGDEEAVAKYGYLTQPCAFIVGAKALSATSLSLTPATSWDGFGSFYKGYVDEIRVWDGARSGTDIAATYKQRFSLQDVKEMRAKDDNGSKSGIYYEWLAGARRNNKSASVLSPELIQHYNFQSLPGAVEAADVMAEGLPVGFRRAVTDNVRKNGLNIDASLECGWWASTPVHSTVYSSYLAVPWIQNTCAHLPLLDGSAVDSMYWSETCGGMNRAAQSGVGKFDFPNSANPYPYYYFTLDKWNKMLRQEALSYIVVTPAGSNGVESVSRDSEYMKTLFQLRSDFVGTSDLVPLGQAFAKRAADFWDGQGAMDAWSMTGVDSDENGIPDWAEAMGYNSVEAYLRALAAGLLPNGSTNGLLKAVADLGYDGLADWWQKMYGLAGKVDEDSDSDGLSNAAEYLASEVFKFAAINPLIPMSDGKELDYFRKQGKTYLGELFSDHDFLEDWWENLFGNKYVSSAYFDTFSDNDEDGWSNWAEARASTSPARRAYLGVDQMTIADYPVPTIELKLSNKSVRYTGGSSIIVNAYSEKKVSSIADAVWTVAVKGASADGSGDGVASDNVGREKLIGMNPGKKVTLNLGPGAVVIGSVNFSFKSLLGYFRSALVMGDRSKEWVFSSENSGASAAAWVGDRVCDKPRVGDAEHGDIVFKKSSEEGLNIGEINYQTGEITVDLSVLQGTYTWGGWYEGDTVYAYREYHYYYEADYASSYIKVNWQSVVPNQGFPMTVYLADSEKSTDTLKSNGHVLEGDNTFTAFVDLDGNGMYTEGEPFGMAKGVDVGWNSGKVEIELTDESPIAPRMAMASTNNTSRLYVYRYGVDEMMQPSSLKPTLIREFEFGERSFVNEADFLAGGEFDIDWKLFQSEVMNDTSVYGYDFPVTSVTYRVYSQPVDILAEANAFPNGAPFVEFTRKFGETRAKAVPRNDGSTTVFFGSCPTFSWKMSGEQPESYTAFAIQIKDSAGETVWNSGKRFAPVRDSEGYYNFVAPVYVGDQTTLGKVFGNRENYTWAVTMYNSKYQSDSWSAERSFRMNAYEVGEINTADRCSLNVAVKYFGPGAANGSASDVKSKIRVEAYASSDFSGEPAGRAFVTDVASLANDEHQVNAVILGLNPGTYYVRAYLDSDGDFAKSNWESWGYACYRGVKSIAAGFTAADFTLAAGKETPTALVYIEDTDVDRDAFPDVFEYDTAKSKTDFLLEKGPADNTHNGYIQVNPDLETSIRNLVNSGATTMSLTAGGMASPLVALMFGVDSVLPEVEANTLQITSLALEGDIVKLTVAAAAKDNSSLLAQSGMFVPVEGGKVTVTIAVKSASSLGGDWSEDTVEKTFEIEDGMVGDTLEFSLSELGLNSGKGFFKVELKR